MILAALFISTAALAQTLTPEDLDKAKENAEVIRKAEPVKDASVDDLAWLRVTFSTDKSGEDEGKERVGSEAIDGADVKLIPTDPEFATVLAAIKTAAVRKAKAAGDEIKEMGLTIVEEPKAAE